jgi:CheY-like chemotaxis protein
MNAIVGFVDLLNEPDLTPGKQLQYTSIIAQSSNNLLAIITDLVNIATIEAGQVVIYESEFDLNAIMSMQLEQYQLKAKERGILLDLLPSVPEGPLSIISDQTKLVQIITNLVGNAIKFTKQGHVSFGYKVKDNQIEFSVEDTGIGIPSEMHEMVFKRFSQVETILARQFGGSGLGLSISKAYVELLGGKIWLQSEVGVGSTFCFTIPLKIAVKAGLPGNQATGKETLEIKTTKTILIAEDEDTNFLLLKAVLSSLNIRIVRAVNGVEAVEACRSNRFDLILMDIKMPVMDGHEATRQIRKFRPNLPIIAQTAYSALSDKTKALESGCNDFISKPIQHDLLLSKIKTAFKEKA